MRHIYSMQRGTYDAQQHLLQQQLLASRYGIRTATVCMYRVYMHSHDKCLQEQLSPPNGSIMQRA